jgi:agmatinase
MDEARVTYSNGVVGPVDGLQVPRFAGHTTFARLPRLEDVRQFDISLVGVPFDAGTTYRPGARFGPSHIRQSSRLLRPYNPALDSEPFHGAQVVDAGDIPCNPFHITEALEQIESGLASLQGPKRPVVILGGDHTIALPALRAMHKVHGLVALVHFDAHLDTWNTYYGEPYTHGTPFRRASEEGLVVKGQSAHVGIRDSLYARSDLTEDADLGYTILPARDLDGIGVDAEIRQVLDRVGTAPVYLSIDIDVLDPAFAPGTGTPEAGGLTSRELLAFVRGLDQAHLVGADIVEVSPAYDHAEVTGIAAANLAYEIVTVMTRQHERRAPAATQEEPQ